MSSNPGASAGATRGHTELAAGIHSRSGRSDSAPIHAFISEIRHINGCACTCQSTPSSARYAISMAAHALGNVQTPGEGTSALVNGHLLRVAGRPSSRQSGTQTDKGTGENKEMCPWLVSRVAMTGLWRVHGREHSIMASSNSVDECWHDVAAHAPPKPMDDKRSRAMLARSIR